MTHTKDTCCQSKCSTTKPRFLPLGDRVLVKRLEQEEKLKGGILLPDSAKKKQEEAEVIAVGPGKRDKNGHLIEMEIKEKEIILMEKYAGQEVKIEDEEFVILNAGDIIAKIQK